MNQNIHLIIDNHHGVYIPKLFAEHCSMFWENIDSDDVAILLIGPSNNEWYWEAWERVLNNARHPVNPSLTLHHDGDLWSVDYDNMTEEEKRNFGFED